jgi:chloramphenicol 3-O phosphotransferase
VSGPDVILLNGPSSAGKTTIARALQARLADPYLCVAFDDFVFFNAERYYRGADTAGQDAAAGDDSVAQGCRIVPVSGPGEPLAVRAEFGPVFRRTFAAIAPTVRAMVAAGNRVIFDHVIADRWMWESWRDACGDLAVLRVGVTCPIAVLEARERARGDRVLGRARGLAAVVHTFCDYDLTVDTGTTDVRGCVDAIAAAVGAADAVV